MNIEEFLLSIKDIAARNGIPEVYMVGGVPRDRLMGRLKDKQKIRDIDLTTGTVDSAKLAVLVAKQYPDAIYRTFSDGHSSIDYGSAHFDFSSHFVIPGIEAELTRLGITNQSDVLKEIFSRDFTMNTILESLDFSQTFDLTKEGVGDIKAGLIRCPIDPRITIGIDARRILRAIKFAVKFDFSIENRLKGAMLEYRKNISNLPPKFVNAKINEIIALDADKGLDKLIEFKILPLVQLSKSVYDLLIQKRKTIHAL